VIYLKLLVFFVGVPAVAIALSTVLGEWIVGLTLVSMVVYMAGALVSAWTFLGEPASIGHIGR